MYAKENRLPQEVAATSKSSVGSDRVKAPVAGAGPMDSGGDHGGVSFEGGSKEVLGKKEEESLRDRLGGLLGVRSRQSSLSSEYSGGALSSVYSGITEMDDTCLENVSKN